VLSTIYTSVSFIYRIFIGFYCAWHSFIMAFYYILVLGNCEDLTRKLEKNAEHFIIFTVLTGIVGVCERDSDEGGERDDDKVPITRVNRVFGTRTGKNNV
jgi:hypothetical protein